MTAAYSLETSYGNASREAASVLVEASNATPLLRSMPFAAPLLMRRAGASVAVNALEPALRAIDSTVIRLGGFVAGSSVQSAGASRSAALTARIPGPRLDEAVAALGALGKIESINISADDVSEEFVDVTARLENSRRLERRLLDLLAQRTGGIKDVLQVEQALARVREDVERIEGRRRYLETHAATSTLEVRLHEPTPVMRERTGVFGDAVAQAWRNFVSLAAFGISSLGTILPLGAVATAAWLLWRRRRRARPAPRTA
jgi:hypothetical protein